MSTEVGRRRKWFSFRLRTLLVVITLVGPAVLIWRQLPSFAELSRYHANEAQSCADTAWGRQRFGGFTDEANAESRVYWERYAYHHKRHEIYARLAWLTFSKEASSESPSTGSSR